MVSTGLTLEKAKAAGYNAVETGFNDLQKPEFMKHDNYEVAIKIVFDKDSREILGAQWYLVIQQSAWEFTCSHWLSKNMLQLKNWH